MTARRATTANKIAYVMILVAVGVFWLFSLLAGWFMLSMSALGKLDGGFMINAAVTVYVLVFLVGVTAFLVATWKARKLSEEYVQFSRLARMPRPTDPAAASVWPWIRMAWWAWLVMMTFIVVALVAALVGIV